MKLLRFGPAGQERPGLLDDNGVIRDLTGHVGDIAGDVLGDEALARIGSIDPASLPEVDPATRLGPCVGNIGKLLCIGLNYSDHAAESGLPIPDHPILFMKANSAIVGPNDDVELPRGSTKTDWEVELGVVIGTKAKYVSKGEALSHVAGYCIVNDVSERHFQTQLTGQWTKGKSADTFAPMGPWLTTADEVKNPQKLRLWCKVNGELRQNSWTGDMMFSVRQLVSYISRFMTLLPGDVIATGTPGGVAMGMSPPRYLQAGDFVECGVEGLGELAQRVVAYRKA